MNGGSWPFFTVKDVLNVAESNFRFASESGRSECGDMGSSLRLLMAGSRCSLTLFNGNFGPGTGRSGDIFRG